MHSTTTFPEFPPRKFYTTTDSDDSQKVAVSLPSPVKNADELPNTFLKENTTILIGSIVAAALGAVAYSFASSSFLDFGVTNSGLSFGSTSPTIPPETSKAYRKMDAPRFSNQYKYSQEFEELYSKYSIPYQCEHTYECYNLNMLKNMQHKLLQSAAYCISLEDLTENGWLTVPSVNEQKKINKISLFKYHPDKCGPSEDCKLKYYTLSKAIEFTKKAPIEEGRKIDCDKPPLLEKAKVVHHEPVNFRKAQDPETLKTIGTVLSFAMMATLATIGHIWNKLRLPHSS